MINIFLVILTSFTFSSHSFAKRSQVIDFEDAVVEGVNQMPYDSLTSLSDKYNKDNKHLYKKRKGFRFEVKKTLQSFEGIR